jgi:elongation factor 1-alpha
MNIALIGPPDAGKSSLIGYFHTGELDDGNGSSRATIACFKHEIVTGKTSSVNTVQIRIPENNPIDQVAASSAAAAASVASCDLPRREMSSSNERSHEKVITFVDLAGQGRYLIHTLHGLANFDIVFAIICVAYNNALEKENDKDVLHNIAKDHIRICINQKIPFMIVITKVDINYDIKRMKLISDAIKIFCKECQIKFPCAFSEKIADNFLINDNICPIIKISAKTGENLNNLREFIYTQYTKLNITPDTDKYFKIYKPYHKKGRGLILHGMNKGQAIKRGDQLLMGPIEGNYYNIRIRSIHDEFQNDIKELPPMNSGCFNIKLLDKVTLTKRHFVGGKVIIGKDNLTIVNGIKAHVDTNMNVRGTTTIGIGYTPIFIGQGIKVLSRVMTVETITNTTKDLNELEQKDYYISKSESGTIILKFEYPQYIKLAKNSLVPSFILYDGKVRAYGSILEVF